MKVVYPKKFVARFTDSERTLLRKLARKEKVSEAEIIRRALYNYEAK